MDIPKTVQPQLRSIGQSLGRSMQRHLVENDVVRSAFEELAFELELARQMQAPVFPELLAPSA